LKVIRGNTERRDRIAGLKADPVEIVAAGQEEAQRGRTANELARG
jgi:hypothetical protein